MSGLTPLPWHTRPSRAPSAGIYNAATRALAGEEGLQDSFADDEETLRQWSYPSDGAPGDSESSPRPSGGVDHRAPTQDTVAGNHAEDVDHGGVGMPEDAGNLASENAGRQRQPKLDRKGTSDSLVDDLRLMNEESQGTLGIAPPTDSQTHLAADRQEPGFETEPEHESSGRSEGRSEHDASGGEDTPAASSRGGSRSERHGEERDDGELRRGGSHRGGSEGSGRPSAASSQSGQLLFEEVADRGQLLGHFWEPAWGGDAPPPAWGGDAPPGEEDERMGFAMLDDYLPLQNGGCNLLARIRFIIQMIWWTGLTPRVFEFTFPGSLVSAFLVLPDCVPVRSTCALNPEPPLLYYSRPRVE